MSKPQFNVLLAALLLIVGCVKGGGDDSKHKLDGTWEVESAGWGGAARDPGQHVELAIHGDRWEWKYTNPDSTVKGTYRIDPTTKPATLDITTTEGPGIGEVSEGIYECDGDTLKLAFGVKTGARTERPRSFDDERVIVMVLKRKK